MLCHELPWQYAVYTRRSKNDIFVFSHVNHSTQRKAFLNSLRVNHLNEGTNIKNHNIASARGSTVLLLVTGNWAQHVSLESYNESLGNLDKIPSSQYDHFERMSMDARRGHGECAELTKDYRSVQYQSTLSNYTKGDHHLWELESVVPLLSDVVIVPRLLKEDRLKITMSSFNRALKKSLRDSLILAGGCQYKEETWERKTPYIQPDDFQGSKTDEV